MNRNDIAGILAGLELTDAQVKGLLDLNSADIGLAPPASAHKKAHLSPQAKP